MASDVELTQLDRERAAGSQFFKGGQTTVADEIIQIDLELPSFPDEHWIIESASLVAGLTVRAPSAAGVPIPGSFPPNTGIFLCPFGTPRETLAESQAGINLNARPFLLPLGPPGAVAGVVAAGAFAAGGTFAMTLAAGFKTTVPNGYFLRAIVSCLQGTATPGPGVNSVATFIAFGYREKNKNPGDCA